MRILFRILGGLKCDFSDFKKVMFLVFLRPYEVIFYLIDDPKRNLVNVEKSKVHGDELPYEIVFFLLGCPKWDLGEVVKAMFHVVDMFYYLIFCLLAASKYDLDVVEEETFLAVGRLCVFFFAFREA